MALAQETPSCFSMNPRRTSTLAHQHEILELIRRLNRDEGRTIVAVLHDVNAAAWVSDHVAVMRSGELVAEGSPKRS